MSSVKLCYCYTPKEKQEWTKNPNSISYDDSWPPNSYRSNRVKRIRLTCSKCERRVKSSVRVCSDGCCIIHELPKHKPKGWMKKKNRKPRKSGKKKTHRLPRR